MYKLKLGALAMSFFDALSAGGWNELRVFLCVRACVRGGLTSMRILGRLRFFTPSAEVAAPPAPEERDAVACWYTLARFHAGLEGVGYLRRLVHVHLAFGRIAFLAVGGVIFQPHRNRTVTRLPVLTLSTEVLALTVGE